MPAWVVAVLVALLSLAGVVVGAVLTYAFQERTAAQAHRRQMERDHQADLRALRDARAARLHQAYETVTYVAIQLQRLDWALFPFAFDGEDARDMAERHAAATSQDRKSGELNDDLTRALIVLRLRSATLFIISVAEEYGTATGKYKRLLDTYAAQQPRAPIGGVLHRARLLPAPSPATPTVSRDDLLVAFHETEVAYDTLLAAMRASLDATESPL